MVMQFGCRVNSNGVFQATRNGNQPIFVGYDGNTKNQNVTISATGEAYFAGNVGIGTDSPGRKLTVLNDGQYGRVDLYKHLLVKA